MAFTGVDRALTANWMEQGKFKRVMAYVALRCRIVPRLYLIRVALTAAHAEESRDDIQRFAQMAIDFFPDSISGYLELAKLQMAEGDSLTAQITLLRAPETARASKEFRRAMNTIGGRSSVQAQEVMSTPGSFNRLNDEYHKAVEQSAFVQAGKIAKRIVYHYPNISLGYFALAKVLEQTGKEASAIKILASLPGRLARPLDFVLLQTGLLRKRGDDVAAHRELLLAQLNWPRERRILMRLAELYRDDSNYEIAHSYLLLAESIYPEYGAVRKLAFQTDAEDYEEGEKTLQHVLTFSSTSLARFLPMVNRVSVYYPRWAEMLRDVRIAARLQLWREPPKDSKSFSKALLTALANRWFTDVDELLFKSEEQGVKIPLPITNRIARIKSGLSELAELVEMAWSNEHEELLLGTRNGEIQQLKDQPPESKAIEFFIPTAFFAHDHTEKPTYETVRSTLLSLYRILALDADVLIIPRLQLNWRYAVPRANARVISYHTHGQYESGHLRIQESPLAGLCSADPEGFAGFSSIAKDFSTIEKRTEDISREQTLECRIMLHAEFVENNVSKYAQAEKNEPIEGDYIFLAMQVSTDLVARLASIDSLTLLESLADFYKDRSLKVVVKRHPYCGSMRVQKTLEQLSADDLIVTSNNSVHDLIAGARAVFTVNSGTGLEALLHGKPVIVTGDCDYEYAAQRVRSEAELREVLSKSFEANQERINRFLYFYRHEYLLDISNPNSLKHKINSWLNNDIS